MDFASRFFYINVSNNFQGFLKLSTIREYDKFLMKFDLFRFRTNDKTLIKSFEKECIKNSTRIELVSKIDSILEGDCVLDCSEVETYSKQLSSEIGRVRNNLDNSYMFCINNKLKVVLNVRQAIRLYYDLKAFYENYLILETVFKMSIKTEKKIEILPNNQKITDKKPPPPPPDIKPLNILDNIVSFCLSKVVRLSLIHQTITYFRYTTKEFYSIKKDENKTIITLPNIVSKCSVYNTDYYRSLILSISTINIQQVSHYINKLVSILESNSRDYVENSVHVMMISYLIFLYFLRCTYDSHTRYIIDNVDNILNDVNLQTKIFNHNIDIYCKSSNVVFKVVDLDVFEKSVNISDVGKEYSYLISVDEEKFIQTILKETKDNVPKDFMLSTKKVLDLRFLRNTKKCKNGKIFESNNDNLDGLLDYVSVEQDFTDAYRLFKKYNNDPSVLMLKNNEIPKSVLNLFDCLKKILVRQNFAETDVSTLGYYNKLCDLLPNAKLLTHTTILYIVFQIVIPFHYEIYGTTSFVDQLLF